MWQAFRAIDQLRRSPGDLCSASRLGEVRVLTSQLIALILTTGTLGSATWQGPTQERSRAVPTAPIVAATDAPAGTEALPVKWVTIAVPDHGVMRAAIARPSGPGPFPAVVVLHGTHGFARQYVDWAHDLARGGFIAVAGCWFSGGGGAGATDVTPPIPCPQMPPLASGEYPEAVPFVDALVQATRALPDVRADRLALVGHSRGAGEATLKYLLANGNVQAAVLHSSGYALRPWQRAAEFSAPILLMHGTADSNGPNSQYRLAREFEIALRGNNKPVETAYCEGCGHNTFFTDAAQRADELKKMTEFLRRHLGS
jgi:dienelactone hydrolase